MTDPLGQSQVLPYLCGLSKQGIRFTLISCEKPDRLAKYKDIIEQICKQHNITWYPLPYTKQPPVLSTLKDIVSIRTLAISLHQKQTFDVIHCRSYIPALIGLHLKRKYGCKFIFDMRGFWADERIDGGLWRLENLLYRLIYNYFKQKEKAFINQADTVVCLTSKAEQEMRSWEGINSSTVIKVIPCCADTDLFDSSKVSVEATQTAKAQLGITPNDFILGYLGSLGTWYLLDEMLDFFIALKERKSKAKFLFITGDEHTLIRDKAKQKGILSDDILIQQANRQQVPVLLQLCSASVFFIKPSYSKMASSPTKQAEIMAMGIPIFCNDIGDTGTIVNQSKSGFVVELKKEAYSKAIENFDAISFNPATIRASSIEYFSLEEGIKKYLELYK
jgi:glycosyltransferase involved in cell wall biosynthesis